ncbi:2-C-methyl-D-erythritol 4-phosphate cytidylyltransferase [Candidatus Poribacteria bacterium]|nr:2-C-methyl-D-erythritol 4-phosphate cytidylyltransferase [Candidatus Poribacteria bacterium]
MDSVFDALLAEVIVPAAGTGSRLGGSTKKTYLRIEGEPLLVHTLRRLGTSPSCAGIWVVVASEDIGFCESEILPRCAGVPIRRIVSGGATRQESVLRALQQIPSDAEYVVVHDGARPLVPTDLVARVLNQARTSGAATTAVPAKDTLRRGSNEHVTGDPVPRENLWRIQTPQAFRRDLLLRAHEQARSEGTQATDDAALVERLGVAARLVMGDERNIKITTPDDLPLATALLRAEQADACPVAIRTGLGYDVHRLAEGRRLILGGCEVPHTHGLLGHSDADALAHAICDALLGAAGLGDIGTHFPDTDPAYHGADSMVLLARTVDLVSRRFRIVNIDSTVKAEAPKLNPHIGRIRERLADVLGIDIERVNVKAKTGERMGPVGERLAIETEAIATLELRRADDISG